MAYTRAEQQTCIQLLSLARSRCQPPLRTLLGMVYYKYDETPMRVTVEDEAFVGKLLQSQVRWGVLFRRSDG
eukprot:8530986-Alexandrium_andersonii.AAC.1